MHNGDGRKILLLGRKTPLVLEILEQTGCTQQVVIGFAVTNQIEFFG